MERLNPGDKVLVQGTNKNFKWNGFEGEVYWTRKLKDKLAGKEYTMCNVRFFAVISEESLRKIK